MIDQLVLLVQTAVAVAGIVLVGWVIPAWLCGLVLVWWDER